MVLSYKGPLSTIDLREFAELFGIEKKNLDQAVAP
jgi:hypothetical protein